MIFVDKDGDTLSLGKDSWGILIECVQYSSDETFSACVVLNKEQITLLIEELQRLIK